MLIQSFCIISLISNIVSIQLVSNTTNCSLNDLNCILKKINETFIMNKNTTLSDESETCIPGHTYFDLNIGQCRNCSTTCPVNSNVHKKCNGSHDTQCICKTGYFMAVDLTCKPCSQCESGWGVWRTCRWSRNTVCRKCPPGTFSGVQTGTLGCILCTICNPNEELLQECSGVHDSICMDRNQRNYLNHTNEDSFSENDGNALPIYFTVLIVLILSLISYVLIQLRIKKLMKLSPNVNVQQNQKYPAYNYQPYRPNSNNNYRQMSVNQISKSYKTLPNMSPDKEKLKNYFIVKRYSDLNHSVRRAFEINLSQNKTDSQSWKKLAKELGYSCASISAFDCLGRQRMNAIQYFLTDWNQYEDSTISSLSKALLRVGRIDCALIIDPTIKLSSY